jgi:hypothetical protein
MGVSLFIVYKIIFIIRILLLELLYHLKTDVNESIAHWKLNLEKKLNKYIFLKIGTF